MKIVKKILIIIIISIIGIELTTKLTYADQEKQVTVKDFDVFWQLEEEFIESTYYVTSQVEVESFKVLVERADNELPEGIKIVDENYQERTEFKANESFKITIPWTSLKQYGNFKINIEAKGKTGGTYYDSHIRNYELNTTSILIIKKNLETGEFIQGVGFEILNSKKEVVYSNLVTDGKGEIYVGALLPGTYYVKEVSTTEEYELNNEEVETKIEPYETAEVIVNGIKKVKLEPDEVGNPDLNADMKEKDLNSDKELNKGTAGQKGNLGANIIVEKKKIEDEMNYNKKLPVTGM